MTPLLQLLLLVAAGAIAVGILAYHFWGQFLRTPRICGNCTHWDREEGQAIIRANPIFRAAAQQLPPAEMGRTAIRRNVRKCEACGGLGSVGTGRFRQVKGVADPVEERATCPECDGRRELSDDELGPPSAPYRAKWDDFGACMHPDPRVENSCTWSESTCPYWQRRRRAARR